MILSRTAIYALRVLTVLARAAPAEKTTAQELNEVTAVPRHYLNKVMQQLIAAGLVEGIRGQRGGFRLAAPPAQIRFADVLQAVNMELDLGRCVFRSGACNARDPCVMHDAWSELQQHVADWAERTTLADLRG